MSWKNPMHKAMLVGALVSFMLFMVVTIYASPVMLFVLIGHTILLPILFLLHMAFGDFQIPLPEAMRHFGTFIFFSVSATTGFLTFILVFFTHIRKTENLARGWIALSLAIGIGVGLAGTLRYISEGLNFSMGAVTSISGFTGAFFFGGILTALTMLVRRMRKKGRPPPPRPRPKPKPEPKELKGGKK